MLYYAEVAGLMEPFPGRKWRMHEIIRYVESIRHPAGNVDRKRKKAIRIGVGRVLDLLIEHRMVIRIPPRKPGSYALYVWKSAT